MFTIKTFYPLVICFLMLCKIIFSMLFILNYHVYEIENTKDIIVIY